MKKAAFCALLVFAATTAFAEEANKICPDKQGTCPQKSTCCKTSPSKYGCCPLQNAVCCSDFIHCCPSGFTCDVTHSTCTKGDLKVDWMQRMLNADEIVTEVECPDKKTECPTGSTCCSATGGGYACCPMEDAVCCSDKQHCCPMGYACDVKHGRCNKKLGSGTLEWQRIIASPSNTEVEASTVTDVVCPDGQSSCPSGDTCCHSSAGGYACCPEPNAVCCSDGQHCCPENTECDVAHDRCLQGDVPRPFLSRRKLPETVNPVDEPIDRKVCPDKSSNCPNGDTCCKSSQGGYGCCPMKNAVCCSDEEHCCPENTECDVAEGKCTRGDVSFAFIPRRSSVQQSTLSIYRNIDEVNVQSENQCPDKISTCPVGTTCCPMKDGYFGCCPYENGVCCKDFSHCCPSDSQCNATTGECETKKQDSEANGNIVCPDKSTCPSETTCCDMGSGRYGCCPTPDAVCCSDHIHCCQKGEQCDVKKGECVRNAYVTTPWMVKTPATPADTTLRFRPRSPVSKSVVCPGKKSECPDGNTCCEMQGGGYGCCPMPNATCCDDKEHCCPQDYTCDRSAQCVKRQEVTSNMNRIEEAETVAFQEIDTGAVIPWVSKIPAKRVPSGSEVNDATRTSKTCPDGQSSCDADYTCCQMLSGEYGCCPLPKAVCCSDGLHCCPEGSECDLEHSTCQSQIVNSLSVSWISVQRRPLPRVEVESDMIVCPDHRHQCPSLTTCCPAGDGEWGCCPLPEAVCCSDQQHCCPHGYECDDQRALCERSPFSNDLRQFATSETKVKPLN